jgi:hypothetical protein
MIRLILIVGMMTACAPSDRNISRFAGETQVWHTVSADAQVFRDGHDSVLARTIILDQRGKRRHYLSLSVLRRGPNGPQVLTVSQDLRPLPYVMHDRLKTNCTDTCHKTEIGAILLTQQAFSHATKVGMTIRIDGLRRNYLATVLAAIFRDSLTVAINVAATTGQ